MVLNVRGGGLTRREMEMGGLLLLLMNSLLRTTLLKGALERRARNLYNCKKPTVRLANGRE